MKTYQLIHVCKELGARSCNVTLKELLLDDTISPEELEAAMKLEVGGKMLLHYGGHPVKTGNLERFPDGNLIRKEDVNR